MTNPKDESSQGSEFSMLEHLVRQGVSRRQFMTACSALTATLAVPPFLRSGVALAVESAAAGETTFWSSCVVNCGSRCPLRVVVRNGEVVRIEAENTGADACAGGRCASACTARSA